MNYIECASPQAHFTEEETEVTMEDRIGSRTHCKAEVILGTMGLDLYFSVFFFFFFAGKTNQPLITSLMSTERRCHWVWRQGDRG